MVDNWERECDAFWGWLRRIIDISHPSICFCQEFVAREEGSGVAIRTHAEHDGVENGKSCSVLLSEFFDELLFVVIG